MIFFVEGKNTSLNKSGSSACSAYDRFIPNRSLMDNDRSHHLLIREGNENGCLEAADGEGDYSEKMKKNLGESNSKILTTKKKAPMADDGNYVYMTFLGYFSID
eukprot:Seg873.7 transcript_id=Seg873.7/GoldUCD/mRNA.D3Y31 product="hypothetical protein" protein_id=Seg873.7/GoldUCD/D3Y31